VDVNNLHFVVSRVKINLVNLPTFLEKKEIHKVKSRYKQGNKGMFNIHSLYNVLVFYISKIYKY